MGERGRAVDDVWSPCGLCSDLVAPVVGQFPTIRYPMYLCNMLSSSLEGRKEQVLHLCVGEVTQNAASKTP